MPWERRKELHIDIDASFGKVLMKSANDSSLLQPPPDYVAGDKMPVRIYFWKRGVAGALIPTSPGPDTVLIFSAKPQNIPPGSDLLFLTTDFTEIEEGQWEGTLDLSSEEFQANLDASPAGAKLIVGEVEVRDSVSNLSRVSYQFHLTARPQVFAGENAPLLLPTILALKVLGGVSRRPYAPQTLSSGSEVAFGIGTAIVVPTLFLQEWDTAVICTYTSTEDGVMPLTDYFWEAVGEIGEPWTLRLYVNTILEATWAGPAPIAGLLYVQPGDLDPASGAIGTANLFMEASVVPDYVGQMCLSGSGGGTQMHIATEISPSISWFQIFPS